MVIIMPRLMTTVIIRRILLSTVQYLQDLSAIFYSLFHPGVQDVFDWSETGPIIKGGEETHANGAGQGRWSGYPAASLIKGLYGGKCVFLDGLNATSFCNCNLF